MQSLIKKISFLLLLFLSHYAFAQDTLPKFSVSNLGNNRIVIGWVNGYGAVKQISIQRSFDSLNYYKTILSVADPNAVQNGFADTKASNDHMFYRLLIVLDGGNFLFTEARRPRTDGSGNFTQAGIPVAGSPGKADSAFIKKPEYVPSVYVYTNADGYVFINLPDADQQKYRIKFFEANNALLFELKSIKHTALTLDKANFLHAGWYKFELYNDEKLVERNQFYLANDF